MIGFAFSSPPFVVAHMVSSRQEGNIRSDIAVISNRYYPISMNSEIASDPTICANAKRSCIINWPDNFGIFSDFIADGTEKIPLFREEPGSRQSMIDKVYHNSFFDSLQLHL